MPNHCHKCGKRVEYAGDRCGGCKKGTGYINRSQVASTDVSARTVKAISNAITSAKWNPINNPIYSARRAAERQAEAHAYFQSLKQQHGGTWPYKCMLSPNELRDL